MKKLINYSVIFVFTVFLFYCKGSDSGTNPTAPTGRNGIFLHHSTGLCIWGPNGSTTTVPDEVTVYNTSKGLTGSNAFSLSETWWPNNPDENEWERWHRIYENQDPAAVITSYYSTYRIIITKSCFPSSAIGSIGQPSDTTDPTSKTIYNYKWHWRHIVNVMKTHSGNFFVIWTNAPLIAAETTPSEAQLSHEFCMWAKDTLARGLDPIAGTFPKNVYVFDFFHKLADANHYLPAQYSQGDSHPNAAATQLVAPLLVKEMFDAFLAQ
jgi:hypothetical protein